MDGMILAVIIVAGAFIMVALIALVIVVKAPEPPVEVVTVEERLASLEKQSKDNKGRATFAWLHGQGQWGRF